MRTIEEYSFNDLVNDMNSFGNTYQIKKVSAGGSLGDKVLGKNTYIVIYEESTVKSSVSLPDIKIGISIHGIDDNTIAVYFEYKNTFNKKGKKFSTSNSKFQEDFTLLFDKIGCGGAFHVLNTSKTGCGVTVRHMYWNNLPDILHSVYEEILSKSAFTAYESYGRNVSDVDDIDEEFAFHELDDL